MFTMARINILLPCPRTVPKWLQMHVRMLHVQGFAVAGSTADRVLGFELGYDLLLPKQGFLGVPEADRQVPLQHHGALMLCTQLPMQLSRLLLESQMTEIFTLNRQTLCTGCSPHAFK